MPAPTVEIDTDDAYHNTRQARGVRPWLIVNMISSADGAMTIDGVSGGLASPGDKDVFGTLRTLPDVILVGAGTAIAEDYNPPSSSVSVRARRLGQGAWPVARVAVVSNSLSLDPTARLFGSRDSRPIVITSQSSDGDRRDRLAEVADIVVAGEDRVDLGAALESLAGIGASVVLCEGGPSLNAQLVAADLVDEMCISLSPMIVGGDARRIVHGAALEVPAQMELRHVLTEDHYLFLRYTVSREVMD
ncbi:MAG: pyrimidine reductase family protein [Actinomycetia bacterium]|nr:pyrimidine reductase family protein [Actinomycetes bacterium]